MNTGPLSSDDVTYAFGTRDPSEQFQFWEFIRRRFRIVGAGIIVGMIAAVVYYFAASAKYDSQAEILLIEKRADLPAGQSPAATAAARLEYPASVDTLSTHVRGFRKSKHNPLSQTGMVKHGLLGLDSIAVAKHSWEGPVEYVIRNLDYVYRGGSEKTEETAGVLRVEFQHSSSEDAQAILAAVVESYRDFVKEKFQDASSDALVLIEQAKNELETTLHKAESEYVAFLEEAPLFWSGEVASGADKKPGIPQQRLDRIESELSTIRARRVESQSRLKVVESANLEAAGFDAESFRRLGLLSDEELKRLGFVAEVIRGDAARSETFQVEQPARIESVRAEYDRQLDVLMQVRLLTSRLGPEHYKVQDARRQESLVNTFLRDHSPHERNRPDPLKPSELMAAYIEFLQNDVKTLQLRETQLEGLAVEEMKSVKALMSFEVRGEMLRNDLDRRRRLFDMVVEHAFEELYLMKDYSGFRTELITPVEPGRLYWLGLIEMSPLLSFTVWLLTGSVLGCMGGVGGAIIAHNFDKTYATTDDARRELKLPILSYMEQRPAGTKSRWWPSRKAKIPPDVPSLYRVAHDFPGSESAESYRRLRNILIAAAHTDGRKVIQIVSPNRRDGRTALVANLATTFAQAGLTTLAIDCDVEHPCLSQAFGASDRRGLMSFLCEQAQFEEVVQATPQENMHLVPVGRTDVAHRDLFLKPRFAELLKLARERFDFVFVDGPALLGQSSALAIAVHCDAALFSVRIVKGGRVTAVRARELLDNLGTPILGLAITGADDHSISGIRGPASCDVGSD